MSALCLPSLPTNCAISVSTATSAVTATANATSCYRLINIATTSNPPVPLVAASRAGGGATAKEAVVCTTANLLSVLTSSNTDHAPGKHKAFSAVA